MRKKELLANKVLPYKTQNPATRYVTGSTFKTSDGKVLETDYYEHGELFARHFTWKGGWLTYRGGMWTSESLRWIAGYYSIKESNVYKKAVIAYTGKSLVMPAYSHITGEESNIATQKEEAAIDRKYKRIKKLLKEITPPLPKDFQSFIKKELIVSYPSVIRDGKVFCLACGEEIKDHEGEKDGTRIRCKCGELTTLNVRKKYNGWTKAIQLYQPLEDGTCMERQFHVEYGLLPSRKKMEITITEKVRGISEYTGDTWDKWYYGLRYNGYGNTQTFWDKKSGYMTYRVLDKNFYLYDRNLDELDLTQECISTIWAAKALGVQTDWSPFLQRFNSTMEAIVKSGIKKLAIEEAKGRVPMLKISGVGYNLKLHERLGISRKNLQKVRQINGGYISIQALQKDDTLTAEDLKILEKYCNSFSRESWFRLIRDKIPLKHVKTLLEKSGNGKINQYRIRTYIDYLNMAEARGSDIHDEIIYRCKRWEEYHDRYVEERNAERARQQAEQTKKELYQKRKKFVGIKKNYERNVGIYGWECKDYKFILPKTYKDIIDEGQMQHNCVGATDHYITKMATDESFIVFLRKKEDPDKSFYTIEIDQAHIIQAYSAYNRKEEWDSVKPVLDKWTSIVRKRLPIAATAM